MRRLYALVLIATVASACREPNGDSPDAAVVHPDGPDGTGCTALTPRTEPLETFVGPTALEVRMNELIDSAKTTLDVQMYLFTVTGLANKIVAAKNRGVAVRVLLDPDHAGNDSVKPIFTAGGVTWKNAPALYSFSHAKYLIVDRREAAIMSMNFNVDALRNERNYGAIDRDPEDLTDLQAIFDQDWAMASGQQVEPANLTCTRLVVSPTNSKTRLVQLIAGAQTTLDVELMYISETGVRDAIVAAKARGVEVRALLLDPMDEAIPPLRSAGIPVKLATAFYLHAKLIFADNVAFIGSENMSFTSLTKNREVGVLAFEPSELPVIRSQFETDWAGAQVVP